MMKSLHFLTSVLTYLGTAAAVAAQTPSAIAPPGAPAVQHAAAVYSRVALSFEPNHGQTSSAVQWISRGPDYAFFLTGHDAVLQLTGSPAADDVREPKAAGDAVLRMNLLGARSASSSAGEDPQPGKANYFTGKDPSRWQRDVPLFGKVRLPQVYPGVDLVYYGSQGHLEYDFVLAPGADASRIRLGFEGATAQLDRTGNLVLPIAGRRIQFEKPVVYQMRNGRREPVAGEFALAKHHQITFHLGAYDRTRELIIDPTLLFVGTLATGNQSTLPQGMAVTAAGEMIFTGRTYDLAFPVTPGAYQTDCGTAVAGNTRCGVSSFSSAFVTKISADGTHLIYSSYLHGGQGEENGVAVALDTAGVAYLTGTTTSSDFPVTPDAYQSLCSPIGTNFDPVTGVFQTESSQCYAITSYGPQFGGPSTYVVKLNATGDQILYGTFLGGSGDTSPVGITVDAAGNFYVATWTASAQNNPQSNEVAFPTTPTAYQIHGVEGGFSATLSKFSNDGRTLLYSSYLGAPKTSGRNTFAGTLTLGQNNMVFLGGFTFAADFPTTPGAIKTSCVVLPSDPTSCEGAGGFVAAFDTSKSGDASLVYSTLINGTQSPYAGTVETAVQALVADSSDNLYITGHTYSNDFPTTSGAFQTTCNYTNSSGHCDAAFIAKINPTGTAFLWSTYYGSTGSAGGVSAYAIALDAAARIFVYGFSLHGDLNLPQVNPLQPFQEGDKVFVATFSPDASQLLFGTRFGGVATDSNEEPVTNNGIAVDGAGNIFFGGSTQNSAFPVTSGAFTSPLAGGFPRGFFAKISPALAPLPTTSTLTISPQTAATGQPVTFTSIVTASSTTAVPTGTVSFLNGSATVATVQLDATGTAVYTTSSLVPGNYNITAAYGGDSNFAPSGSAPQMLTIELPLTPSIEFTLSSTAVAPGTNVTLTATLTGSGATPTGTVMFFDGATVLATAPLDPAGVGSTSSASFAPGTHFLSVKYAGDAIYGAAQSPAQTLTVSTIPTTTTLTAAPASVPPGTAVLLTATVVQASGSTAPSGTVTFLDGATTLGSGTLSATGVATLSITTLPTGTHSISASYAGSATFSSSVSTAQTVTVSAQLAPSIALTFSDPFPLVKENLTLTATLTGVGPTPTGTVMFFDGATLIDTATLNAAGIATFSSNSLTVGTHVLTTKYAGDSTYGPAQTAPQNLFVSIRIANISLSASSVYAPFGTPVVLTAQVGPYLGDMTAGIPTGTVTFFDDITPIGTVTLSATGVASLTIAAPSLGLHFFFCTYNGSDDYGPSQADVAGATIEPILGTTTTLNTSANPSGLGAPLVLTASLTPLPVFILGMPLQTGTVDFFDGSTLLGSGTLVAGAYSVSATYTTSTLALGTHSITAVYRGDPFFIGSTSPASVVTIANPGITLSANSAVTMNVSTTSGVTTLTATGVALTDRTYLNLNFCYGDSAFTCSAFSNPTLVFNPGDGPQSSQVTVTSNFPIVAMSRPDPQGRLNGATYAACMLPILGGLGVAGATRRKKFLTNLRCKNSLLLTAVLSLSALLALNGCVEPPAPASLTPGTYTLGVFATQYNMVGSTPTNIVEVTTNITVIVQ